MKKILLFMAFLPFALLAQQSANNEASLNQLIEEAEYYFEQATTVEAHRASFFYGEAYEKYRAILRINPDIPDVYYQLCKCSIGAKNVKFAKRWLKEYKKQRPDDKQGIADLEQSIKYYEERSNVNWNKERLQKYKGFIGYEYQYANARFVRNDISYRAPLHGMAFEKGYGSGVFDVGIYHIPYGHEDTSF